MAGFGYGYYYSTLYWPRSDEDAEWRWKPYLISALPQGKWATTYLFYSNTFSCWL